MRVWMLLAVLVGFSSYSSVVEASLQFEVMQDCWQPDTAPPPDWSFDGVILSYAPEDGIKVLRSDVGTTYYIAFAGSNFIEAAGISPDGAFIAIPYGTIQTVASSDVRYSVGEMRIYDTARISRIRRILPWRASFQYGDIPAVTWLDGESFLYAQGSFIDGQTWVTVEPFAETPEPEETMLGGYLSLSPDQSRAIGRYQDGMGVYDTAIPQLILRLPEVRSVRWSPDGERFVAVVVDGDTRTLRLFHRNGEPLDEIFSFTYERNLWNLAWSPDGERLLFTLYDPQANENRLHIADIGEGTVTDTCVKLSNAHSGDGGAILRGSAAVWSPDGEHIALITETSNAGEFQIAAVDGSTRYGVTGYAGGLLMWGLGE